MISEGHRQAVTVHRCLNGHAPLYLSDYCVPAAGADTRRQLRSSNRQLLAVSTTLSVTPPSVQTVSDACLRRICLLNTSALSALAVQLRNINLLTYLRAYAVKVVIFWEKYITETLLLQPSDSKCYVDYQITPFSITVIADCKYFQMTFVSV